MIREISILQGWLEQHPDHQFKVEPKDDNIIKEKDLSDPHQPAFTIVDRLSFNITLFKDIKDLASAYKVDSNSETHFLRKPIYKDLDTANLLEAFDAIDKLVRLDIKNKMGQSVKLNIIAGFYISAFYFYLGESDNIKMDGACYKIFATKEEECLENY